MLRLSILIAFAIVCAASPVFAQSEGRVSVGASVTLNRPTDADVASMTTYGPLVRLNPHRGWGPAGALNWFRPDLARPGRRHRRLRALARAAADGRCELHGGPGCRADQLFSRGRPVIQQGGIPRLLRRGIGRVD